MLSRGLRNIALIAVVALVLIPSAGSATAFSFSIVIPRIHLNTPLNYVSADRGPYVYYQDSNTLAIAGHRVTHTHPFYYINELRKGDPIYIVYNGHRNVYHVWGIRILRPTELKKVRWFPGLILSACHPRHTDWFRYVVLAK
jgi:sortase (surface protein transpeptidase)